MTAYYNEKDPFAANWLRNLIKRGLIAPGDVDERSIENVVPVDLKGYTQCHFFAGIGGWSYALRSAGWDDNRPVWTGSCPCQPFSLAGKQRGFDDARHLWPVWQKLINECRPSIVFGEQVASATEWLGLVRSDLEAMGYAVGAMPIQAASAGADHLRDRYWFVAHTDDTRSQGWRLLPERAGERSAWPNGVADADSERGQINSHARGCAQGSGARQVAGPRCSDRSDMGLADADDVVHAESLAEREPHDESDALSDGGQARSISGGTGDHLDWVIGADGKARRIKPGLRLLAHGVPGRVGKLRGFGNAIDPRPAAAFIEAADYALALGTQK